MRPHPSCSDCRGSGLSAVRPAAPEQAPGGPGGAGQDLNGVLPFQQLVNTFRCVGGNDSGTEDAAFKSSGSKAGPPHWGLW